MATRTKAPAKAAATAPAKRTTAAAAKPADNKPAVPEPVKIDPTVISGGDILAVTYYVQVANVLKQGESLQVKDLHRPIGMTLNGKDLLTSCQSADQYNEERKCSRTEVAETLMRSYNKLISVCFTKKDGTERVLRGRMLQPEPVFGRSHCEDLELPQTEHRLRLVTHETLKWLVVDGVRYSVK